MLSTRNVLTIPSRGGLQGQIGAIAMDADREEAGESIHREGGFMPEIK